MFVVLRCELESFMYYLTRIKYHNIMRKIIIIALSVFMFSACTQSKEQSSTTDFHSVFEIPDSLLTVEQDLLKRELVDVIVNHLNYKDDKFVFQMTKEEFLKKGFAPDYYDIITNNFDESNKTNRRIIDFDDDIDWEKLVEEKIKNYKKSNPSKTEVGILNNIPKDTLIELESFAGKPDSDLTASELETKIKFTAFLESNLKVIDNHFVLDAEPQDFEKAGLSKYYYDLLKVRIAEANNFVDSLGGED